MQCSGIKITEQNHMSVSVRQRSGDMDGRISAGNSGFIVLSSGKMVEEGMQRSGTFLSVAAVEGGSDGVQIDPLRIGLCGNFTSEF